MKTPPDPLDNLLNRWSETPEPSPRLAAEVWHRLSVSDEPDREPGGFWAGIEAWFARPPFAVLFITSCALLGLFLAELRVSHLQRERSAQLARSYLQLIDPLLNTPDQKSKP